MPGNFKATWDWRATWLSAISSPALSLCRAACLCIYRSFPQPDWKKVFQERKNSSFCYFFFKAQFLGLVLDFLIEQFCGCDLEMCKFKKASQAIPWSNYLWKLPMRVQPLPFGDAESVCLVLSQTKSKLLNSSPSRAAGLLVRSLPSLEVWIQDKGSVRTWATKPAPQVEGRVASIKDCYFAPFPSLGNFKTKRKVPLADNSINEVLPENRGMG